MMYILDDLGYIEAVSSRHIACDNKECVEYTGATPEGYDTLEQWATTANIRAYKIVDGQLVYDADRAAALEEEWSGITANKTLLFEGVAASGDTIELKEDYTKYSMLHVVVGTDNEDFGGALIGSTLSINNEINAFKNWCNPQGMTQIHVASFIAINNKQLVVNGAYWQILADNHNAGLGGLNAVYIRRIYGTL